MTRRTRSKASRRRKTSAEHPVGAGGDGPASGGGPEPPTKSTGVLLRSSSLGDIGRDTSAVSAVSAVSENVAEVADDNRSSGSSKKQSPVDECTPPTVPTLDVAGARGSLMTAPAAIAAHGEPDDLDDLDDSLQHTTRGERGVFLTGRQRQRTVYDSARNGAEMSPLGSVGNVADETGKASFRERDAATARPPRSPRLPSAAHTATSTGASDMSLSGYLVGELVPSPVYHTADSFWGQTERDRVYNALWYVPYQLERLIGFGNAICLHAFLGIFTMLPLRVVRSVVMLAWRLSFGRIGFVAKRSRTSAQRVSSPSSSPSSSSSSSTCVLRGDQVYDLIIAGIFVVMTLFLWHIRAGAIYFWVKELTQEFLKLSVLHTALELGDKICCSFGVDVLEALAASCTTLSTSPTAKNVRHVVSDAMVALLLMVAHAGALMCQALVYGVAMNSKKNSLLALLIASNFTEIKGTVFKRYDPMKIFTLTCQDIVERFHLYVIISFVLVEESVGSGQPLPSPRLVVQCLYVLLAEIVIDVTKHSVLGKFNNIRPGVYAEFTKDLCENLEGTQSHNVHKLVGIEPFASAALFFRVFVSFVALQREVHQLDGGIVVVGGVVMWFALIGVSVLFGYGLRSTAARWLTSFNTSGRIGNRGGGIKTVAKTVAKTMANKKILPTKQRSLVGSVAGGGLGSGLGGAKAKVV